MKKKELNKQVRAYLDVLENQRELLYIHNNSGALQVKEGFVKFNKKGSPDILIFLPNGKTVHLELKVGKNKQSEEQIEWREACNKLGHYYSICYSLDEVIKDLKIINENNE